MCNSHLIWLYWKESFKIRTSETEDSWSKQLYVIRNLYVLHPCFLWSLQLFEILLQHILVYNIRHEIRDCETLIGCSEHKKLRENYSVLLLTKRKTSSCVLLDIYTVHWTIFELFTVPCRVFMFMFRYCVVHLSNEMKIEQL